MGLFDKKVDQQLAAFEAQNSSLKEEVVFLRRQVERFQEALIAKESPEAYRQIKMDESAVAVDPAEKEKRQKQIDIYNQIARIQEAPLFEDVDELITSLTRVIGAPVLAPVHEGNSES